MKVLLCPHCQTRVSDHALVCSGCGAEVVRGLSGRERSLVGLACVGATLFIAVVIWRALQIAGAVSPLPSPKAEDGLYVIMACIALIVAPYFFGKRLARFIRRSQVRFYRVYRHQ
jgi:hypothetical protein